MVEGTNETEFKYYFVGSVRIALREDEAITWLLSDHLNSTSVTVDATGNLLTSIKYTAFGELRTGTSTTDYQYTGQRNEAEIGLYYYVARYYDPQLARFISADTIVPQPGSSQGYDRYAYTNNNPISFNDPSGHRSTECGLDGQDCGEPGSSSGGGSSGGSGGAGSGNSEGQDSENNDAGYTPPVDLTTPTPRPPQIPQLNPVPTLKIPLTLWNLDDQREHYSWNPQPIPTPTTPAINHAGLIGLSVSGNPPTSENSFSIEFLLGDIDAIYVSGSYGIAIGSNINAAIYVGEVYNIDTPEEYLDISIVTGITASAGSIGLTGAYGKADYPHGPEVVYLGWAPGLGISYWESYSLFSNYYDFGSRK